MQGNNEVREETLGGAARAQPSATVQNVQNAQRDAVRAFPHPPGWAALGFAQNAAAVLPLCLCPSPTALRAFAPNFFCLVQGLPPVWLPEAVG